MSSGDEEPLAAGPAAASAAKAPKSGSKKQKAGRKRQREAEGGDRAAAGNASIAEPIDVPAPKRGSQEAAHNVSDGETSQGSGSEDEAGEGAEGGVATEYPYEVDDSDHCETPLAAYQDISPLLEWVAAELGKSRASLRVYDPFFCEGAMKSRMAQLGFESVYNEKEDFYDKQRTGLPEFDVLVTNPPYSGDNVERLLRFCAGCGKPFFLLMPNWVYPKDYFWPALTPEGAEEALRPIYVVPPARYQYSTPKGRRQAKSGKRTAPFPSFWYANLGAHFRPVMYKWMREAKRKPAAFAWSPEGGDGGVPEPKEAPRLLTRADALPAEVVADGDPRKKKLRDEEKRKKRNQLMRGRARGRGGRGGRGVARRGGRGRGASQ